MCERGTPRQVSFTLPMGLRTDIGPTRASSVRTDVNNPPAWFVGRAIFSRIVGTKACCYRAGRFIFSGNYT
jgi:hypothetical protein